MTVLLQYAITGNSLNPTTQASGVSGGALTNGSLNVFHAYSPGFASDPILDCNPISNAVNAATAVQYNSYFSFTLTPGEGKQVDLSSFAFNASRGGSSTPRGWVLRSSADSFAANIATDTVDTQVTTWDPFSIDLSGAAFQGLQAAITFRLYVYCPDSGKAVEFDDITVNGTVEDISSGYTLTAAAGSFAETGNSAGLLAARLVSAASGSVSLAGVAASLLAARVLSAGSGSLAETGGAVGLRCARSLAAAAGALALTGNAAALPASRLLSTGAASLALTGAAAGLQATRSLTASPGEFAVIGTDTSIGKGRLLTAAGGSFATTGQDATLTAARALACSSSSYTLTGYAVSLHRGTSGLLFRRMPGCSRASRQPLGV